MTDAPSTPPPPAPEAHPPVMPPRAFSLIGVGVLALTVILLISIAAPVIHSFTAPAPPPVEPMTVGKINTRKGEFTSRLASAESKIRTRSPFSPPPIVEAPKPRTPARYGGPNVIGVAAGEVYFSDNSRIPLNQEKDGIKVLAINAPWSVRLGWMGGEYDVTLLERNPVDFGGSPLPKDTLFKTVPIDSTAAPKSPTPPSPRL